jgi:hypothetical protein
MRKAVCFLMLTLFFISATAQKKPKEKKPKVVALKPDLPALDAIKEADLQKDLYAMASDRFRGREAGTLDELKVSAWWAEEARKAGLKPAGDDSTYFQFFSIYRNRVSLSSTILINGNYFQLWSDVLVAQTASATVNAPIVFVGTGTKAELDKADIKGKAVAVLASTEGINLAVSIPERRYPTYILNKHRTELINRGAVAIIFIADEMGERSWSQVKPAMSRGLYDIEGGANAVVATRPPILWVHASALDAIKKKKAGLTATITVESFLYPSVNIVAAIEGKDKILKSEYVLFSGHQDHDGVRQPYGSDSVYNGADDNASVSVAMLAIARAFKKNPGKRSALFVWHGAEERGLLGSKWYSSHPTVPASSIVAVLNGDMIGRNHPDSAALLGSQLPHRNSAGLVTTALEANNEGPKFKLDTLWDKPTHIEGWYFRSDHLPYARAGFPALFYTTLLHPTYHTPMDDAEHIDYAKLKRMTEWMFRTGWKLTNAAERPIVDEGFKLER